MAYAFRGTGTVCGVAFTKKLKKVDEDDGGGELDITGGGDVEKCYEPDLPDRSMTIDVLGGDALVRGTAGATSITWGDGTTTAWASSVVTKRKKSGSVGSVVVYSVTVRKTAT